MHITFLGGGDEIGASSAIVEIGSGRVLVDCGIRMTGESRLPDLAAISSPEFKGIDAVILTHAHMDHSGALPVFHQHFPGVPIYATGPAGALVEVLLRDSINVMKSKLESEGELPLYSATAVESLLERIIPVPFGSPMEIGRTGMTVTWFPAGHILGAASVGIEGVEQGRTARVLVSGDISVSDQLTVPGMLAPAGFRPDVLVMESTYGNRLHSPRGLEEKRLVEMVAGVIERRGKLLIPAFAIGRAQEVTLVLLREFRAGRLARFPVYIDGMVRSVCGVYSLFPAHQTPYARRLIEQHGNPFFNVVDEIQPVASPKERDAILNGPPCCIIASSGMLTGGASTYYAQGLVESELNGIAITGYQDEEAPGRRLLELAEGETSEIVIGGRALQVKCSVAKYALSAHADANEIASLVEAINPREVVLVHGDGSARPALAELLWRSRSRHHPIHLPKTGETLRFGASRRILKRLISEASIGIGGGIELTAETLPRLAEYLREHGAERRTFSTIELLDLWHGAHAWDESHYTSLIQLLDDSDDFRRHPSRPHLYRLKQREGEAEQAPAPTMLFAEPNELLARVDQFLGPTTGLYKRGYDLASHELRLSFESPQVARERYRDLIERVVEGTGWTVTINEMPHQGRLAEVALECLPAGLSIMKAPAIHLDRQEVVVALNEEINKAVAKEAAREFKETTGFTLVIKTPGAPATSAPEAEFAFEATSAERMEINVAYRAIDEAFTEQPETWRPYKKSLKSSDSGPFIELAFISPEIGARQSELLHQVVARIGYPLRIKPEPNQIAMIAFARHLIPKEWQLQKQPSLFKTEKVIRVKCAKPPSRDSEELGLIQKQFTEATGYTLEIEG
ncbi:MAG: MBL fold metallo-hydrolase [Acidobacteria bacterium]|nr:MBL fold metallo-hydrolase [Acidobacteriota bacterium]